MMKMMQRGKNMSSAIGSSVNYLQSCLNFRRKMDNETSWADMLDEDTPDAELAKGYE
jgi:hypothetical protein